MNKSFKLVILILLLFPVLIQAQFNNVKFGVGISTMQIIGDNIATRPFVYEVSKNNFIFGGSFDQAQSGIRIEAISDIDEYGDFQLPIGLEYHFLMGREKAPINAVSNSYQKHDASILGFTIGVNWVYYKLRLLKSIAEFYVNLDARTSIIFQGLYKETTEYNRINMVEVIDIKTKETTVRVGGNVNLGLSGDLIEPLGIDLKIGLGVLNLIGRDDTRGELLTIKKKYAYYEEDKETLVPTYNFNLFLIYKF